MLVRNREEGEHTEEELLIRFNALDSDGNGRIDAEEYVKFSLRDALHRSSTRVLDLFHKWDENRRALTTTHYTTPPQHTPHTTTQLTKHHIPHTLSHL